MPLHFISKIDKERFQHYVRSQRKTVEESYEYTPNVGAAVELHLKDKMVFDVVTAVERERLADEAAESKAKSEGKPFLPTVKFYEDILLRKLTKLILSLIDPRNDTVLYPDEINQILASLEEGHMTLTLKDAIDLKKTHGAVDRANIPLQYYIALREFISVKNQINRIANEILRALPPDKNLLVDKLGMWNQLEREQNILVFNEQFRAALNSRMLEMLQHLKEHSSFRLLEEKYNAYLLDHSKWREFSHEFNKVLSSESSLGADISEYFFALDQLNKSSDARKFLNDMNGYYPLERIRDSIVQLRYNQYNKDVRRGNIYNKEKMTPKFTNEQIDQTVREMNITPALQEYIKEFTHQDGVTSEPINYYSEAAKRFGILFSNGPHYYLIESLGPSSISITTHMCCYLYIDQVTGTPYINEKLPLCFVRGTLRVSDPNPGGSKDISSLRVEYDDVVLETFDESIEQLISARAFSTVLKNLRNNIPIFQIERDVVDAVLAKYVDDKGNVNIDALETVANNLLENNAIDTNFFDYLFILAHDKPEFAATLVSNPMSVLNRLFFSPHNSNAYSDLSVLAKRHQDNPKFHLPQVLRELLVRFERDRNTLMGELSSIKVSQSQAQKLQERIHTIDEELAAILRRNVLHNLLLNNVLLPEEKKYVEDITKKYCDNGILNIERVKIASLEDLFILANDDVIGRSIRENQVLVNKFTENEQGIIYGIALYEKYKSMGGIVSDKFNNIVIDAVEIKNILLKIYDINLRSAADEKSYELQIEKYTTENNAEMVAALRNAAKADEKNYNEARKKYIDKIVAFNQNNPQLVSSAIMSLSAPEALSTISVIGLKLFPAQLKQFQQHKWILPLEGGAARNVESEHAVVRDSNSIISHLNLIIPEISKYQDKLKRDIVEKLKQGQKIPTEKPEHSSFTKEEIAFVDDIVQKYIHNNMLNVAQALNAPLDELFILANNGEFGRLIRKQPELIKKFYKTDKGIAYGIALYNVFIDEYQFTPEEFIQTIRTASNVRNDLMRIHDLHQLSIAHDKNYQDYQREINELTRKIHDFNRDNSDIITGAILSLTPVDVNIVLLHIESGLSSEQVATCKSYIRSSRIVTSTQLSKEKPTYVSQKELEDQKKSLISQVENLNGRIENANARVLERLKSLVEAGADSTHLLSLLCSLPAIDALRFIQNTDVLSRLTSDQATALATHNWIPAFSKDNQALSSQADIDASDAAATQIAQAVLNVNFASPGTGLWQQFKYFWNHPIHSLTERQLLDISRKHPVLWNNGSFSIKSWFARTFGSTKVGAIYSGRSLRDQISTESYVSEILNGSSTLRIPMIQAVASDPVLLKKILANQRFTRMNVMQLAELSFDLELLGLKTFQDSIDNIPLIHTAKFRPIVEGEIQDKFTSNYREASDSVLLARVTQGKVEDEQGRLLDMLAERWIESSSVRDRLNKDDYFSLMEKLILRQDVISHLKNNNEVLVHLIKIATQKNNGFILSHIYQEIPTVRRDSLFMATQLNMMRNPLVNLSGFATAFKIETDNIERLIQAGTYSLNNLRQQGWNDRTSGFLHANILPSIARDASGEQLAGMVYSQLKLLKIVQEKHQKLSTELNALRDRAALVEGLEASLIPEPLRGVKARIERIQSDLVALGKIQGVEKGRLELFNDNLLLINKLFQSNADATVICKILAEYPDLLTVKGLDKSAVVRTVLKRADFPAMRDLIQKQPSLAPYFAEAFILDPIVREKMLNVAGNDKTVTRAFLRDILNGLTPTNREHFVLVAMMGKVNNPHPNIATILDIIDEEKNLKAVFGRADQYLSRYPNIARFLSKSVDEQKKYCVNTENRQEMITWILEEGRDDKIALRAIFEVDPSLVLEVLKLPALNRMQVLQEVLVHYLILAYGDDKSNLFNTLLLNNQLVVLLKQEDLLLNVISRFDGGHVLASYLEITIFREFLNKPENGHVWDTIINTYLGAASTTTISVDDLIQVYLKANQVIRTKMVSIPTFIDKLLLEDNPLLIPDMLNADETLRPLIIARIKALYAQSEIFKGIINKNPALRDEISKPVVALDTFGPSERATAPSLLPLEIVPSVTLSVSPPADTLPVSVPKVSIIPTAAPQQRFTLPVEEGSVSLDRQHDYELASRYIYGLTLFMSDIVEDVRADQKLIAKVIRGSSPEQLLEILERDQNDSPVLKAMLGSHRYAHIAEEVRGNGVLRKKVIDCADSNQFVRILSGEPKDSPLFKAMFDLKLYERFSEPGSAILLLNVLNAEPKNIEWLTVVLNSEAFVGKLVGNFGKLASLKPEERDNTHEVLWFLGKAENETLLKQFFKHKSIQEAFSQHMFNGEDRTQRVFCLSVLTNVKLNPELKKTFYVKNPWAENAYTEMLKTSLPLVAFAHKLLDNFSNNDVLQFFTDSKNEALLKQLFQHESIREAFSKYKFDSHDPVQKAFCMCVMMNIKLSDDFRDNFNIQNPWAKKAYTEMLKTSLQSEAFAYKFLDNFRNQEALKFFGKAKNEAFVKQLFKHPSIQEAFANHTFDGNDLVQRTFCTLVTTKAGLNSKLVQRFDTNNPWSHTAYKGTGITLRSGVFREADQDLRPGSSDERQPASESQHPKRTPSPTPGTKGGGK